MTAWVSKMEAIFRQVLSMSVVATIVMLAVLVIRLFLKRAPRSLVCLLWIIVAVRLTLPFAMESKFSLIPSRVAHTSSSQSVVVLVQESSSHAVADGASHMTLRDALPVIWFVGFLVMFSYLVISSLNLRRKVLDSVKTGADTYISDRVGTPFVLGLIMPKIYLSSSLGDKEAEYALKHERAHLRRRDNVWKFLGYLLLSVYWFNPIVWISFAAFSRDIELACDEKVISTMDVEDKKAYASALLSCATNKRAVFSYQLCFGDIGIKERILAMKNYKKPTIGAIVLTSFICLSVAGCFLTDPEATTADTTVVETTSEITVAGEEGMKPVKVVELDPSQCEDALEGIELKSGESVYAITDSDGVQHIFIFEGEDVDIEAMLESGEILKVDQTIVDMSETDTINYTIGE